SSVFSFALDSAGDSIYLSSGDALTNLTGYSHGVEFGGAAESVTFGRDVISTGVEDFPAQLSATPASPNAGPVIGVLVINEIFYNPPPGDDAFVGIQDRTGNPVALYDPAHPSNGWRLNGVDFNFPTNALMPAGGSALIVETMPEDFR